MTTTLKASGNVVALAALAAALSLSLTPLVSFAQTKPLELRYSSGAPPKGNPWVKSSGSLKM
jgi:TRAP-type C4-dicarboxylate transport system substrate-binding protein